jgi:hypothetical protein
MATHTPVSQKSSMMTHTRLWTKNPCGRGKLLRNMPNQGETHDRIRPCFDYQPLSGQIKVQQGLGKKGVLAAGISKMPSGYQQAPRLTPLSAKHPYK